MTSPSVDERKADGGEITGGFSAARERELRALRALLRRTRARYAAACTDGSWTEAARETLREEVVAVQERVRSALRRAP